MKRLPLLLLLLLWPVWLRALDSSDTKDILLICTHAESSDWAQEMIGPVQIIENERNDIRVFYYFLHATSLSGTGELEARKKEVLESFGPNRPALAIIVGGSGYIVAKDLDGHWPGVPIIMAGENDYYCNDYYTIRGNVDPRAKRTPVSTLLDRGLNLTLIKTPAMVEQTVELMKTLLPHMQKLIFIAGENFQCREQQIRLEAYLWAMQSHLDYEVLYSSSVSTDELIERLKTEDNKTTGFLFGSWLTHEGYMQNVSSRHNVTHIIETIVPLFTLFWCNMEKNQEIVGFHSYDHELYREKLTSEILEVVDGGVRPRDMPFVTFAPVAPTVNWNAMQEYGMDTRLIPKGAEVLGKPRTLWNAYGNYILSILIAAAILCVAVIIVMMRRALKAEKKALDATERANDVKNKFIQNMTHEIRTPLHAITGFAQLLCLPDGYNTDEEKAEYLSFVTNNTDLLTMMVNDILSLSDDDNGEYKVNIGPCNINNACLQAIKSVEHRITLGVKLRFDPGVDDGFSIPSDSMRVQQVLINLLTNAYKFTQEGHVTVHSSLEETPGFVTLSVADTGPGIPAGQEEVIFDRFVKLDSHKQGAGLGLNVSRLIARKLGGDLFVDKTYTHGSRFVFIVPLAP